ncbi:30S ribosomal protein S3 [Mycoplasmoides alvi]|uniref:30S ribosomal protein S3 n=1 Tax=Mycoplasmoides alvi TaxID=78580 RepID=UPI00051BB24D|nr:30S ribosomal protein S3 [Mycoplasmoides alvi]
MGQKVNSNGLRYGINKNWQSRWIARTDKEMGDWLVQDEKIRKFLFKKYHDANISNIEIERGEKQGKKWIEIFVYASQVILVIGQKGNAIPAIIKEINKIVGRNVKVDLTVNEIGNPALSARLIAREMADNIQNRVPLRSAMRMALKKVLTAGGQGIKVLVSGRLNGAEIARDKMYIEGNMPLSTLRADIDYALEEAHMSYGVIGVKIWINRGEIFGKDLNKKPVHLQRSNKSYDKKTKASHKSERSQIIESSDILGDSILEKDGK